MWYVPRYVCRNDSGVRRVGTRESGEWGRQICNIQVEVRRNPDKYIPCGGSIINCFIRYLLVHFAYLPSYTAYIQIYTNN
jgi:hypothetical protein